MSTETRHPERIYVPNVVWERGRNTAFGGVAMDDDVEYVRADVVEELEGALRKIAALDYTRAAVNLAAARAHNIARAALTETRAEEADDGT